MVRTRLFGLVSAAVISAVCGTSLARPPVGTEFTYQGQLLKSGLALNTPSDFRFSLWDGPSQTATQIGSTQNVPNIAVNAGRFECTVNFGESPYTTNEERWMQVEVRNPTGIGNFSLMGDRQKLTASPFSLATRGINVDAAGSVWMGGNVGVGGTMDTGAFRTGGSRSTHTQGAHLEWNKSGGDGSTWLLNQRGLGGGGIIFGEVDTADAVTQRMRIDGAGNVGINKSAPNANTRLHIEQPFVLGGFSTAMLLRQPIASWGLGAEFANYRFIQTQAAAPDFDGGFKQFNVGPGGVSIGFANTPAYASPDALAVNGRVAIGAATATRGMLEINGTGGSTSIPGGWGFLSTSGAGVGVNAGPLSISLYASNDVHASVFRAFSDARIKNVQGRSDGVKDLDTLLSVEVTDYTFKDTIAKGTEPQKKVIGQQLEQVYPLAVRKTSDIIPDIYKKAPVQGGWVMLGTDLKVGDKVRVIGKDAQTESTVSEVKDGSFRVADLPAGDEVFVYGREVSDFRTVDYEAIAMLNVSATQELARQNMAQQKQIESQQKRIDELESQYAARLAKLEAALADKSTATASK